MVGHEPEIDYVVYTSIHFPSDRLTVADLQRLYPVEFEEQGPPLLPVDPLVTKVAAEHGEPVPLPKTDWLLEQLRAMPTDHTILHLRRQHPGKIDVDGMGELNEQYQSSTAVSEMLWLERGLARIAYQEACGNLDQLPLGLDMPSRDPYRDDLSKMYINFGLARGENEARQMIERFEGEAAAQARREQRPERGR